MALDWSKPLSSSEHSPPTLGEEIGLTTVEANLGYNRNRDCWTVRTHKGDVWEVFRNTNGELVGC